MTVQKEASHNPGARSSGKVHPANANLRQSLPGLMASVHLISPELAAYHVSQMSDDELEFQSRFYRQMGASE